MWNYRPIPSVRGTVQCKEWPPKEKKIGEEKRRKREKDIKRKRGEKEGRKGNETFNTGIVFNNKLNQGFSILSEY